MAGIGNTLDDVIDPDDEKEFVPLQISWFCESCRFTKVVARETLPTVGAARDEFFAKGKNVKKCPRCKSESFVVVGY